MRKGTIILLFFFFSSAFSQSTIQFMVFGDTHYRSPSPNFNESILYELTLEAINEQVDFIFIAGDLVLADSPGNYDSLLADWRFILDTLYSHNIRLYACRGNNDVNSEEVWQALFSGNYALPDNGPEEERYYTYSIEYDNFLFISLDEYTLYERINQEWLDQQLLLNDKPIVIAAGHEPAFKLLHWNCLGAYPEERNIFWNSLIQNNGIIYLSGHDHFYDHTIISDEDGNLDNDVHQIIVGTGGGGIHSDSEYNGDNGIWTPIRVFHDTTYGYVLAEVTDLGLTTTWRRRIEPGVFEDGGDTYSYAITSVANEELSHDYILAQNYPNPFNPFTTIKYQIPKQSLVTLKIYDVLGNEIETLVNEEQPQGVYETEFNCHSRESGNLSSGVYLYKLETDTHSETRKMILLK